MQMKTGPKRALVILAVIGGLYGYKQAAYYGYVPRPNALKTLVPMKAEMVEADVLQARSDVKVQPLPGSSPVSGGGLTMRWEEWAWNAQYASNYANGGPLTTKGSLMEQNGVKLRLTRQDDSNQMQADQLAFASEYCKGSQEATSGVHFVSIMGDGAAQYLAPLNEKMKAFGDDCTAEVIGSAGYSRGEDKFMGPPEVKNNPQAAKGMLVAGVLRDGDWNLAMRWANLNKIPNNPDDRVYDPEAMNWVAADTYIDAAQKYISGFCEDLPLKGKQAEKKHVCVNGVVTWTPGDVMVADQRGGLVTLMDTSSAIFQMPNVIIGNRKWNAAHADLVAGMLAAIGEGADQVRASQSAFVKAGEISAQIYREKDAAYWGTYYKGVSKRDKQGMSIALGGSAVSNLADQFQLFGLSGGPNLFKATYETFGNIAKQQYPNILKSFPLTAEIQNTKYLQMAATKSENVEKGAAEKVQYSEGPISEVIGHRDYTINFATGSDTILPESLPTVAGIFNDLVTSNLSMVVHGHTDNTGSPDANQALSGRRALAVKAYLSSRGVVERRITTMAHGQMDPVASNATPAGRAMNRRVEVVVGR